MYRCVPLSLPIPFRAFSLPSGKLNVFVMTRRKGSAVQGASPTADRGVVVLTILVFRCFIDRVTPYERDLLDSRFKVNTDYFSFSPAGSADPQPSQRTTPLSSSRSGTRPRGYQDDVVGHRKNDRAYPVVSASRRSMLCRHAWPSTCREWSGRTPPASAVSQGARCSL